MLTRVFISIAVCFGALGSLAYVRSEEPNIIIILADDMGIDSVAALNEKCGIETPNLDRLVAGGSRLPMPIRVPPSARPPAMAFSPAVTRGARG